MQPHQSPPPPPPASSCLDLTKVYVVSVFLVLLILGISSTAYAVFNINITGGPTSTACPGQTYTFTASANVSGCIRWAVYENGAWNPASYPSGCSSPYSSSSTFTYTFSTTPQGVTVRAIIQLPGGVQAASTTRTLSVRVPRPASNLENGIVLCSSGGPKTVTISGVPNTEYGCYYHYRYTYEVPTGWTVTPTSGTDFDNRPNVANAQSKTVTITPPSGVVNGGNYTMRVTTQYPSTTQQSVSVCPIIVGPYKSSQIIVQSLSGPDVCLGYDYYYSVNVPQATAYSWTVEGGNIISGQGTNRIQVRIWTTDYGDGYVQCNVNNGCGWGYGTSYTIYPYNCNSNSFTVYPNPASDFVNIEYQEDSQPAGNAIQAKTANGETFAKADELAQPYEITIYAEDGNLLYERTLKELKSSIDVSKYRKGTYYLHISYKGKTEKSHLILE